MTPLKFIHLTDTHVVGGDALLYGSNPRKRLEQAVDSINREHGDAQWVVVTGDLTHWGEEDAYAAFARRISALSMPFVLMMGNHDNTPAFASAFPNAPRDSNGFVQSALQTSQGLMLFLDTSLPQTHAGGFCQKRRTWLANQLAQSTGPVFLFMHHPPFGVGIKGMDAIMLRDAEPFWQVLEPHAGRIRHLFFGHLHRTLFGNWHSISFSCLPSLNHQVALDLETGPEIVHANLGPPAYGVVLVDDDKVLVHQHSFLDPSPRFALGPPAGTNAREYALGMPKLI